MASNRQDRLLMRQRGAGTRQIKELDFQLFLPGISRVSRSPLKPQRSGRLRENPQVELPPRRSTRRTLLPSQLHPQGSSARTPILSSSKKTGKVSKPGLVAGGSHVITQHPPPIQTDLEEFATKKRKINGRDFAETDDELNIPGVVGIAKAGRNQDSKAQNKSSQTQISKSSPSEVIAGLAKGKKRKKRKPIGQILRKKPKIGSNSKYQNIEIPTSAKSLGSKNVEPRVSSLLLDTHLAEDPQNLAVSSTSGSRGIIKDQAQSFNVRQDEKDLNLISPKQQIEIKGKKRKPNSIGQASKKALEATKLVQSSKANILKLKPNEPSDKHGSPTIASKASSTQIRGRPKKVQVGDKPKISQNNNAYRVGSNNDDTKSKQPKRRGRPKKQSVVISEAIQAEEDNTTASEIRETRIHQTINRGRPRRDEQSDELCQSDSNKSDENENRKSHVRNKVPKKTIPITVYRLSSAQASNENEAEIDPLNDKLPVFKNRGVNAIDVLSQMCREIILKSSDSVSREMNHQLSNSQKVELEHKRGIIEMYGEELNNRLFQLTEALDNNITLTARIRRATKEEKSLKADLQSLRRRKEELSKRKTETEESRKQAEASRTLHTLLSSIEAAVQAGRKSDIDNPPPLQQDENTTGHGPLELVLESVERDVDSSGPAVEGRDVELLETVKEFNEMLEKAVDGL